MLKYNALPTAQGKNKAYPSLKNFQSKSKQQNKAFRGPAAHRIQQQTHDDSHCDKCLMGERWNKKTPQNYLIAFTKSLLKERYEVFCYLDH